MEDQKPEATKPVATAKSTPAESATPNHLQHDSNPFTTTWRAVQKLFKLNTGTFIGATLFNLLLSILATISIAAVIFAVAALIIKNAPENSLYTMQFGQDALAFYQSFSDASIIISLILGPILFIAFMALGQIIQLKLFISSSEAKHIGFGDLFKQALKRILPFVGLVALITIAVVLLIVIIALLAQVLGFLTIVLGLIAFVAGIYVSLRITFAAFSVISENQGPISALKRSWALSKGHFGEVLGIGAATTVIALVPMVVLNLFLLAVQSMPAVAVPFTLIGGLITFFVATIVTAGIAERFVQLRAIAEGRATATKTHPSNYIAVVLVIALSIVSGLLSPKTEQSQTQDQELQHYLEELKRESQSQSPSDSTYPTEEYEDLNSDTSSPYNVN